jgi:hypothetical protein
VRSALLTAAAVLVGLALASLPFVHFMSGHGPHHEEAVHATHAH